MLARLIKSPARSNKVNTMRELLTSELDHVYGGVLRRDAYGTRTTLSPNAGGPEPIIPVNQGTFLESGGSFWNFNEAIWNGQSPTGVTYDNYNLQDLGSDGLHVTTSYGASGITIEAIENNHVYQELNIPASDGLHAVHFTAGINEGNWTFSGTVTGSVVGSHRGFSKVMLDATYHEQ